MAKRIIILGTGSTCVYCDFGYLPKEKKFNPDVEVYGVNGAYTMPSIMPDDVKHAFQMQKLFMTDYTWSEEGTLNFHPDDLNKFAKQYNTEIVSLHEHHVGSHKLIATPYPYKRICRAIYAGVSSCMLVRVA